MLRALLLVSPLSCLLSSHLCAAQTASQRALAEALFREARALMTEGRYADACPKFAESQRLDPGGGTLLNLAVCHEKQGKLASAWAEFQEALTQAKADTRPDRARLAQDHISSLEPRLAKVVVLVANEAPANVAITLNGTPLGTAAWGTPVPVDAGELRINAQALGYEPYSKALEISDGRRITVEVPALVRNEHSGGTTSDFGSKGTDANWTTAYVFGAVGVAAVGAGSYFGVRALQEKQDANRQCSPGCDPEGHQADRNAVFNGWLATAGFGIGIAALGVAGYLYTDADEGLDATGEAQRSGEGDVAVVPSLTRTGAGFQLAVTY